jgi:enamine deaminase RidA (YjgF/YER057c/UK114 family)
MVFVAGQIGWNPLTGEFESDDLIDQVRQVLRNIVAVLDAAGAGPEQIVRMTWYVLDRGEYLGRARDIGRAYREVIGRHYPAMTAVEVRALIEERAKVEIEVTAVVP